jgi:maleate cis-trans isomerase
MLGWRGRFGYLSAASIFMPSDVHQMLPEGVVALAATLGVSGLSDAELQQGREQREHAIRQLVADGARAIVITGPMMAVRLGYHANGVRDRTQSEQMGVPITAAVDAQIEGFKHLDRHRPLLVTALAEESSRQLVGYLAQAGIEVVDSGSLGARGPAEQSRMDPHDFYAAANRLARHSGADSILLGGRVVTLDVALALEYDLNLPVVYSTNAAVWWALRELGVRGPETHAGVLLSSG